MTEGWTALIKEVAKGEEVGNVCVSKSALSSRFVIWGREPVGSDGWRTVLMD